MNRQDSTVSPEELPESSLSLRIANLSPGHFPQASAREVEASSLSLLPSPSPSRRMLVAGAAHYGLAAALKERYPQAIFLSRSTGYDFSMPAMWQKAAEHSLEYDVFISCAALWRFQQTLLLEKIWEQWHRQGKPGQILVIGSTGDTGIRPGGWLYPAEKSALRTYCRNLSAATLAGSPIRLTYISPGYMSTPKVEQKHPTKKKLRPLDVVNILEWLMNQPKHFNIHEISMDPIQTLS